MIKQTKENCKSIKDLISKDYIPFEDLLEEEQREIQWLNSHGL